MIKKRYNDGINFINTDNCNVEVSLTVANTIKNIIDDEINRVKNARTKALNDFKNSSIDLINNFTNETDFNNLQLRMVDLNNIRKNYIRSNIVNEILDTSKPNKLECKVYLDGKEIGGSIKSINLKEKKLIVDHGNGKKNITISISQICVSTNSANNTHTHKQSGGHNAPSAQPIEEPLPNSPNSYGICE